MCAITTNTIDADKPESVTGHGKSSIRDSLPADLRNYYDYDHNVSFLGQMIRKVTYFLFIWSFYPNLFSR